MNASDERKRLLRDLRGAADPAYRDGAPKILRTGLKMLGVRVPDLRRISRAFRVEHAGASSEEVLAVIDALWDRTSDEDWEEAARLVDAAEEGFWRAALSAQTTGR